MKGWSLKVKFGVYAAALATAALCLGAAILIPVMQFRQVAELDAQIKQDAGEFFRDLENFRGAPISPRHPLSAKFLPLSLEDRYIFLAGPEGQALFESPNLNGQALPSADRGMRTVRFGDRLLRVGTFDHAPYSLQVGASLERIEDLRADLLFGLGIAAPFTALFVFVGGWWLGKRAVEPVAALSAAAGRISAERLHERLPMPSSHDEIASLTAVLNSAFDRLQSSYEAATRFSADASHQLKTPIAVLRLGIEELRANAFVSESLSPEIAALLQQTRRLTALVNDLLLLAQADAGRLALEPEELDISDLVASALDDIGAIVSDRDIEVESSIPPGLRIAADRRRLSLALQVLCENAGQYTPDGGCIHLSATVANGQFALILANTGPAIPETDRITIFERFRRGSAVGEETSGHGLGLNIARTLLRAHGGDVELIRSDGVWTEFRLSLPV